jgi:hypothetical protein
LKIGAFNGAAAKNTSGNRGRFLTYTDDDTKWQTEALDYAADNIARGMITCVEPTNPDIRYETIVLPACNSQNTTCLTNKCSNTAPDDDETLPDSDVTCPKFPCVYTYCSTTLQDLIVTIHYPEFDASTLTLYLITNPLVDQIGSNNQYNLGEFIHRFDINLVCNDDVTVLLGYDVDVTRHSLNLDDVSIEISDWNDFRSTTNTQNGINRYDVAVVECHNYGVRLDGRGNPVETAKIQLNGHDRFDDQIGAYFNYYQPYNHHHRTPADGVNVYSFAIHPEQHQPSGTANLSRIDSTLLLVKFSDPFRATKSVPQLNLARDSDFYVFAFNYNVLRCMSGMAGLAYSN